MLLAIASTMGTTSKPNKILKYKGLTLAITIMNHLPIYFPLIDTD